MDSIALASLKLTDLMTAKGEGEPVNVHVVESVSEPRPDFVEMQRVLSCDFQEPPKSDQRGKQA